MWERLVRALRRYVWLVRHPADPYHCGLCGRLADAEFTDALGQGYCSEEHAAEAFDVRAW